jgi:hypothetical protein
LAVFANDVAYVAEGACQRVDPKTYAVTIPPFANCPLAADAHTGYLYVISGSTLQIWNGMKNRETLLKSVTYLILPLK